MGRGGHYDSFHKEQLGWLNYSNLPPITTVTASGTYVIGPYEGQDSTPKALKIQRLSGVYYYIRYVTAMGVVDSMYAGSLSAWTALGANDAKGVIIEKGTPATPDSSFQFDMTPNNQPTNETADFMNGALAVGQS
jgi:hypothetical protein